MRKRDRKESFERLGNARKHKLVLAFISLRKIINTTNYSFTQKQCDEFFDLISEQTEITKKVVDSALKGERMSKGGGADANFFVKNGIETINLGTGMRDFHTKKETLILKEFYQSADIVLKTLIHEP